MTDIYLSLDPLPEYQREELLARLRAFEYEDGEFQDADHDPCRLHFNFDDVEKAGRRAEEVLRGVCDATEIDASAVMKFPEGGWSQPT